jgi:exodeoxyribonuclease-5
MEIITDRIIDNKIIGDTEMLADKYKVIEKDIYYGYALTAHKSQGSTYDSVIVDEADFQKISNRWNYKYNILESRIKEKNQLRYVAYTRAKNNLFIAL